jgi:hypothetical protein
MINKTVFQQIVEGWSNLVIKDDTVEPLAKERMSICVDCQNFTIMHTCKLCGCFMSAKVRSVSAKCDIDKWPK